MDAENMNDSWNTGIENTVIRPIAKKAIDQYADKLIDQKSITMEVIVDDHKVRLIRNYILYSDFFLDIIAPKVKVKEAQYMINVDVTVNNRCFVGIYYKFKDDGWVEENDLKELTTC